MVEMELEYNSALRRKIDTLIRVVVQDLTLECLTYERLAWYIRPLLEGKRDSEERIIRARMKPSLDDLEMTLAQMGSIRYDRVPLGLVGSGRQIIQTGAAYSLLYNREDRQDQEVQTDKRSSEESDPETENRDQSFPDSLEQYLAETNSDCSEEI